MITDQVPSAHTRVRPTFNLSAAGRWLSDVFRDWRLGLIVGLCFLLLLLVTQLPFNYRFQVGIDQGAVTDKPFLRGFNGGELITWDESWRWSRGEAAVVVPGIGQRAVLVGFDVVSHRAQWQADIPPPVLTVDVGAGTPVDVVLRPQAARYTFYVPSEAMRNGSLNIGLRTEGWQNPNDARSELGVAIGNWLTVSSIAVPNLVRPDWGLALSWPLGLGLLWVAVRTLRFPPRQALLLLVPLALLVPLLAAFEAPRLAAGERWVIANGLLAIVGAGLCNWLVPPLLKYLGLAVPTAIVRWLLLLMVLSFAVKFGGQLYPAAMPGDLQLHVNRYTRTMFGEVYIPAQHRGLPFPFPNAPYIVIAPFTLFVGPHLAFELMAGFCEATIVLIFFITLVRLTGSAQLGLFAAFSAALTAAGFMNAWFSFQTQVMAQWFTALLLMLVVTRWPDYEDWGVWAGITLLFTLAFQSHIGAFLNNGMLGVLLIPLLWLRAHTHAERRGTLRLALAGLTAALFLLIFYYSGFAEMIITQLTGIATVGMVGGDAARAARPCRLAGCAVGAGRDRPLRPLPAYSFVCGACGMDGERTNAALDCAAACLVNVCGRCDAGDPPADHVVVYYYALADLCGLVDHCCQ
ncbi:hypothetical protein HC891_00155 [Candidatus Gracilibacteria bacterium]|nr:hypothetical protein [Candidatus Gracilibacteria bacterium]